MRIGSREFDTEHQTYIMGILNVTPDSISDGGKYSRIDAALEHAEEMIGEARISSMWAANPPGRDMCRSQMKKR